MMGGKIKKKLYLLFAFLALLVALPTLLSQYFVYADYTKKKAWPIIDAQVIKTRIVGKRAILPEITYQYRVNDKTYTGKSDLQTPPFGLRNKRDITARAILREHPVGSTLKIAYQPQNPAISTTGLHLPWNFYMKISFALTLVMVALYLLLQYFRKAV
ncbi:DUF3592 domain-containing protein [Calditrichota bacterium GD2]